MPLESESFVVVSGMVDSTSWLDVGVVVDEVVGLAMLSVVLMPALVVGRVVARRGVVVVVVVVVGVVVVVVGVVVVVEVVVVLVVVGRGVVVVVVVVEVVVVVDVVVVLVVVGRGVVVVVVVVGVVVVVVVGVVVVVVVELDVKGKGCSCTEDPHCTITFCAADPVFILAVTHNTTNIMM